MEQDLELKRPIVLFHDTVGESGTEDPRLEAKGVDLEALFHVEMGQRGEIMRSEPTEQNS